MQMPILHGSLNYLNTYTCNMYLKYDFQLPILLKNKEII